MHILHTSPPMGPSYGGPFQSVRKLAQAQVSAGDQVNVLMPWSKEAFENSDSWSPVNPRIDGRILLPSLGWSPSYAQNVLGCSADLIHTHGIWVHPSWIAISWKSRWQRPHVASTRGMLENWAWRHKWWKKQPIWRIFEKRNLQSASLLHATSDQEADSVRRRGLGAPIAVIPNGIDLPCMKSCIDFRLAQNENANHSRRGSRVALSLCRLHPVKGLPLLLEAWAKVKPREWKLKIAGPDVGGHRQFLEHIAANLGLSEEVEFTGELAAEAKARAFMESSLFIMPTRSENFGISIAEAMGYGLPVITTHGAPWKILETERCGWWVPVSVESIAQAIEDAIRQTPEEMNSMGSRARRFTEENFNWNRISEKFRDCYRWLLNQGPRPDCVQ